MNFLNKILDQSSSRMYKDYNSLRNKIQCNALCQAPFYSLLFIQSGDAMVCHYNRGFSLGKYPENKISDLWNSRKLKQLRELSNDFNLPSSCLSCKLEIENKNYYSAGCKKYDYLAEETAGTMPTLMEFQLDNTCSLACIMCSGENSSTIREKREHAPIYPNPYNDDFIDELRPFMKTLKYANFTGGEPFAYSLNFKIWDALIEENPDVLINISTNGTILNETIKKYLKRGKFSLTISIDSIDKKIYEDIRIGATLEKTLQNFQWFYEYSSKKNRLLSVKFVVMDMNVLGTPELFNFFNNQNIQLYPKLVWMPYERSLKNVDRSELKKIIDYLSTKTFITNSDVQRYNSYRYQEMINQLSLWHAEMEEKNDASIFMDLDAEQLKKKLFDQLSEVISNDSNTNPLEKEEYLIKCSNLLKDLYNSFSLNSDLKNALIKYISLPSGMVVNEMYRENKDNFIHRFHPYVNIG
jgi:radical SAM protein with 4Fe4S-binding SPASM domain